jgi:hypothetical protein
MVEKTRSRLLIVLSFSLFLAALFGARPSFAIGTSAGTPIESYAELYYGSLIVTSEVSTIEVFQTYGLLINPTSSAGTVESGQAVYFPHVVGNVGNKSDRVTFSLSNTTPAIWSSALIVDDNMNSIHEEGETTAVPGSVVLSEDASYYFFVVMSVPLSGEGTGSTTLTATAEGSDGGSFYGANGVLYGGDDLVSATDIATAEVPALYDLRIIRDDATGKIMLTWGGGNADIYYIQGSYEANFSGSVIEANNVSPVYTVEGTAQDGVNRYYRVTKATITNGFAKDTAMKYDLYFPVDFKLVSIPEKYTGEADSDLDVLVGTQLTGGTLPKNADKIYSFQVGTWKQAYLKSGTGWSGSLAGLTGDKAAWVQILDGHSPKTVTFVGLVPTADAIAIHLDTGYNFVGSVYPVDVDLDNSGLSAVLTPGDVPKNADKVYSFQDGAWKQAYLKTGVGFMGSLTYFSPGRGYWIYKQGGSATWNYPRPY